MEICPLVLEDFVQADTPYAGADPNLIVDPVCGSCKAKDRDLKLCSRCHVVRYCSRKCQTNDYSSHKTTCKALSKQLEIKERERYDLGFPFACERARLPLLKLAIQHQTKQAWEQLLWNNLDMPMLRNTKVVLPLDSAVPFNLLFLNRDQDAYSYCRYWLLETKPFDSGELERRLKANKPIFPEEEDLCHMDIFQDGHTVDPADFPTDFLMIICIIKMRLVAKYETMKRNGEDIDQVLTEQKAMLNKLMDQLDAKNSAMLPSILVPPPGLPNEKDSLVEGTLTEVHEMLWDARTCVRRIPGMKLLLEERYGGENAQARAFSA